MLSEPSRKILSGPTLSIPSEPATAAPVRWPRSMASVEHGARDDAPDPGRRRADREPAGPVGDGVGVLVVGDRGDTAGGGRVGGVEHPPVGLGGVGRGQLSGDRHGGLLDEHARRVFAADQGECLGVEPHGVQVVAEHRDRPGGEGAVEQILVRRHPPERLVVVRAGEQPGVPGRPLRGDEQFDRVRGGPGPRDRDPLPDAGPLQHVDVRVDEAGQQRAAAPVDHVGTLGPLGPRPGGLDGGDPPILRPERRRAAR